MTDFGLNTGFSFHRLSQAYPVPSPQHAQNPAGGGPQQLLLQSPQALPQALQAPMMAPMAYMPVQGPTYLSGGYFLTAPQMLPMAGGGLPGAASGLPGAASGLPGAASGLPGAASGLLLNGTTASGAAAPASQAEGAAHVTANSTNALASAADGGLSYLSGAGMAGATMLPGAAGFGMAGMMALPVGFVVLQPMVYGPVLMPMLFGFAMPGGAATASPGTPLAAEPEAPVQAPEKVVEAAPPVLETTGLMDENPASQLRLPIAEMSAADFKRFRFNELNVELTTSVSLNLTTSDGDRVTLEFNQVDLLERMRFDGKGLDGERHRLAELEESTNRVVNMEVDGDINPEERAAIEGVLAAVVEVANRFFNDNLDDALKKLNELDFDNPTLADLSLKMSMTHSVEHTRAYGRGGEPDLARLKDSDASMSRVLDFFASEQKQLIDAASEVLDRPSAVRMVKSLLPPMLEEPFSRLAGKLDGSDPLPDQTAPVVSKSES